MVNVLAKIGMGLLTSLLTEAFVKRVILLILRKICKNTANDLDDQFIDALEKAWK